MCLSKCLQTHKRTKNRVFLVVAGVFIAYVATLNIAINDNLKLQ
jgi:hypothetical protein